MKASRLNISNVRVGDIRIDPEYHLSDGVRIKRIVRSMPYPITTVQEVSSRIFYGGRAKRVYVTKKENGVPFLSSSDILQADLDNVKLASKKFTPNIEDMKVQKGWILISRSGTIGNTAYANAGHAQKLASEHVIRVCPNDILRGGFLYAYLASQYGHSLLTQGTFGAVIQHIEPDFVGSIPVPKFPDSFQKKVDDLIQESSRLREEASSFLNKAVSYFESKYPIKGEITQYFTKKISDLNFSIAAYNNNLEVEKFTNSYISNALKLRDITSKIFAPPLFKHIYLSKDNGFPFMTGSELTRFNMRYYRWLSPKGVKDIQDYVVNTGTLLLYKSGTTDGGILGNVFIADETLNGCCLSDHVIRIVFNDNNLAYWTFAFLKSPGGVKLLQRLATGTMIPFITPERIAELYIPEPDEFKDTIVDYVDKFVKLTSKAKTLENLAISMVEQEIEKWNN